MKKVDLSALKECWPSPFVARDMIDKFSGGILKPRTMANLDAKGVGPKGRFKVDSKRIAYPVDEVVVWLENRSQAVEDRNEN